MGRYLQVIQSFWKELYWINRCGIMLVVILACFIRTSYIILIFTFLITLVNSESYREQGDHLRQSYTSKKALAIDAAYFLTTIISISIGIFTAVKFLILPQDFVLGYSQHSYMYDNLIICLALLAIIICYFSAFIEAIWYGISTRKSLLQSPVSIVILILSILLCTIPLFLPSDTEPLFLTLCIGLITFAITFSYIKITKMTI